MGDNITGWPVPVIPPINLDTAWAKWTINPEAFAKVSWTSEPLKLFEDHNIPGEPMKEVNDSGNV